MLGAWRTVFRSDMTMADRAVTAVNWKSNDCAEGRLATGDMMRSPMNAVAEFEKVSKLANET